MQRIARCSVLLVLLTAGCNRPADKWTRRLPDPLLATRRPAPVPMRVTPRPSRPIRVPRRETPAPSRLADVYGLIPSRGITRGRWKTIVVHHSANSNDSPQSINAYHTNVKHWPNGLGYHFVIGNGVNYPDGKIYAGPRWRRQISGAHCKSKAGRYDGVYRPANFFNTHGIGICLVGNFESSQPTARQIAALEQLIEFLCLRTGISPDEIHGHGGVTGRTACPGRNLSRRLARVRRVVAGGLAKVHVSENVSRRSGIESDNPAVARANLQDALAIAHRVAEHDGVVDACAVDALDHIAD